MEEEITRRVAAAGIRLRFDRVALRLLREVNAALLPALPRDQGLAFTITAPVRQPAKTSAALQEWLHHVETPRSSVTIHGNQVRALILRNVKSDMPRVIGFVHNPECDGDLALDIAATTISESSS